MQYFHAEMVECVHRLTFYLESSMSVTEIVSNIKARFDYIVCLDLIVFVCIFVIANRPDGLAITISALIVGVVVLICRCTLGLKSKMKARQHKAASQFDQRARSTVAPVDVPVKPGSKSWLRDSE
jgi:hypothetical protein